MLFGDLIKTTDCCYFCQCVTAFCFFSFYFQFSRESHISFPQSNLHFALIHNYYRLIILRESVYLSYIWPISERNSDVSQRQPIASFPLSPEAEVVCVSGCYFSRPEMEYRLISAVSGFPCLFDSNSATYRDLNMRSDAWRQVAQVVGVPGEFTLRRPTRTHAIQQESLLTSSVCWI